MQKGFGKDVSMAVTTVATKVATMAFHLVVMMAAQRDDMLVAQRDSLLVDQKAAK